ncbi:MAG: plasmid maintenance protein CcdB [Geobacter sp.]|nr:MAG: plasmid maintenance protein CcdB [Geobacter sp.]
MLDVPADLFNNLTTRVVVQLVAVPAIRKAAKYLNPHFKNNRTSVATSTAELGGLNVHVLEQIVCSLKELCNNSITTLDFLFTGFFVRESFDGPGRFPL